MSKYFVGKCKLFPSHSREEVPGRLLINGNMRFWPEYAWKPRETTVILAKIASAILHKYEPSADEEMGFMPCNYRFEGSSLYVDIADIDYSWSIAVMSKDHEVLNYAAIRGLTSLTTESGYNVVFLPTKRLEERDMPCNGMSQGQIREGLKKAFPT